MDTLETGQRSKYASEPALAASSRNLFDVPTQLVLTGFDAQSDVSPSAVFLFLTHMPPGQMTS